MSQAGAMQSRYVKAGMQTKLNMRINMRDSADLPDAETIINDETRKVFKACNKVMVKFDCSMPVWASLAVVFFFVLVMLSRGGDLMAARLRAERDLNTLQQEYTEVEQEMDRLKADFDKACDSSYICYYAVQELGMKRAADDTVIHISAPDTRPPSIDNGLVSASAYGQR